MSTATAPHPQHAASQATTEGGHADGQALADDARRDGLHLALQQLAEAEVRTGALRLPALCQAHKSVAVALSRLQSYSAAQDHLARAVRLATALGALDFQADLQCGLAEVATSAQEQARSLGASKGALRTARERCRELALDAARLAALTTDTHWEIRVLLRASDVLDRCGEHDDAVVLQQQAMELMGLDNPDFPASDTAQLPAVAREAWRLSAPGLLM